MGQGTSNEAIVCWVTLLIRHYGSILLKCSKPVGYFTLLSELPLLHLVVFAVKVQGLVMLV